MKEELRALVDYRFERARESLEEARILLEKGHANAFVNRLYYASFYAVSALLLVHGLSSSKHSGIRALFHKHLVKPGLVDVRFGRLYDVLLESRQKADYVDMVRLDVIEVSPWYEETIAFISSLERVFIELKD
ncbi:MAG TPA: HEPN domain-containing protein [Spirochaetia bacterium]|nr:HEPN domain-containing protein [Spirochaetia bacterium]